MTDSKNMDLGRVERVLGEVDFFKPIANRRRFMQMFALAGAGAAASAAGLGILKATPALAAFGGPSPADWVIAAVGAERIAVAFYSNALGTTSSTGVAGDAATTSLLNDSHRKYFQAALNQESSHLAVLMSVAVDKFPYNTFSFPGGTFASREPMLAMGAALENIFIGAYLSAIASAAAAGNVFVAEAAAQILGIECEHRVLINDISGVTPPNDRFYEGTNPAPPPTSAFGDSGARSTLYNNSGEAVGALVALGITPHF